MLDSKSYEIETTTRPNISFLVSDNPNAGAMLNKFHKMLGSPAVKITFSGDDNFVLFVEAKQTLKDALTVSTEAVHAPKLLGSI
jgi:hypothetical protein